MSLKKINASILDFPRKTLSEDIWVYSTNDKKNELPRLSSQLRFLILRSIEKNLRSLNLSLQHSNIYGGAASYQWSENSDIDVSVYASGWPANITSQQVEKHQEFFKKIEIPYMGFKIHLFLKPPNSEDVEVADAVYDIINDEWVLPPLLLPEGFDPDIYFKPFIGAAEAKAKKLDLDIGKLQRSWKSLEKASGAIRDAEDPSMVKDRIEKEKNIIRVLTDRLATSFLVLRNSRYALHDKLKQKLLEDKTLGRFERFQQPEIVWKYLDRAGYLDFLHTLYKIKEDNRLEKILAKY